MHDLGDVAVPVLGLIKRAANAEYLFRARHHTTRTTWHEPVAAEHSGTAVQLHLDVVEDIGGELDAVDLRLAGDRRGIFNVVHSVGV